MKTYDIRIVYWAHMLDECFDKEQFLCEDREGKNINRAEKWIKDNHPEVIGQKLENGTTITPRVLTQEIRNTVPNVRMADCKFLVGITRMYFDLQSNIHDFQSKMNNLNKMLRIICTAHTDQYDNDFNGLSFDELDKKFSGAVRKELDSDRENIGKLQLIKNSSYKIIPIDSFEEAVKYGKYTSWCVTHYPDMYSNYTKNGLGRFYFCLQDGFENVPEVESEGCPMDTYGKSMIAVSVNDDGSLNTCTCRWNHDNGANDSMMDTKEISKFFGVDFYTTFKPYDTDQLWKNILKKQVPLRGLNPEDEEFCKAFDCVAVYANIEDEDDDSVIFKKLIDGKIVTLPYIDRTTTYVNNKFATIKNGKLVDAVPKIIFSMPKDIKGDFIIPYGVTGIANKAFSSCKDLKSLTIPGSVTSIGQSAFYNCTSLKNVTIGNGVASIGQRAFSYCTSLTSVKIPDSVTSIGDYVFYLCKSLTNVKMPNSLTGIGSCMFSICKSLTNITIPKSVTSIGAEAFYGCASFTRIAIPDGVTSIGYDTFYGCSGLTSMTIPTSITSIGESAFYSCFNLKSLVFKGKTLEEVKAMDNYPFGVEDESIIKCESDLNENKATYLQKYRDESDVKSIVDMFWSIRNRLSAPQNDIDWWIKKPFSDLKSFVQNFDTSNKRQRRDANYKQQAIDNGAKLLDTKDGYEMWYVPTYDAMVAIGRFYKGRSAKWCVASDDPDFWFDNHEDSEFVVLVREHPQNDEFDKVAIEMMNHGRYYNEDDVIPWDLENEDWTFTNDSLMHEAWLLFKDNGETREQYFG